MNNPSIPESEIVYHRWGWSRHLYVGEQVSVSVAYGKKGGASSLHYHEHKGNAFLVLSGKIELQGLGPNPAAQKEGWVALPQEGSGYVVEAGWSCLVRSGIMHRMVFLEDSVLHEVYQATPHHVIDLDDIVRRDLGWESGGSITKRIG